MLHDFTGAPADGVDPQEALIRDSAGNLYGTTHNGGASGFGTIFKLDAAGNEALLYSFAGPPADGANPASGVIRDSAGNLYGATNGGGASGLGTIFKLDAAGQETVLHSFAGPPADGANPGSGLIPDPAGNLYGTTYIGGPLDYGTVFQLTRPAVPGGAWTESLLHSFMGSPADGTDPVGGLIWDTAGNLYGTTYSGGASNYGALN